MAVGAHFLAFDLGAESGRAMLGRLRAGVLDISEIHRFVNEPVRQNGSLHWDVLRIWLELKQGMERAAGTRSRASASTPGAATTRSSASRACCFRTPITIATSGPTASWKPCSNAYRPTKSTRSRGSSSCRSTRSISSTRHARRRRGSRCGDAFQHDTDLINYWLTGDMTAEFTNATTTQFIDARTRSGTTDLLQALEVPTRILPPVVEPGRSSAGGADAHPRSGTRASWRRPATTQVPRSRRSVLMGTAHFCSSGVVAAWDQLSAR